MSNATPFTRREFLHTGLTLASATIAVPAFIQTSAFGMPRAARDMASIPDHNEDRVLVVVQLSGGNDGLNTVIPFEMDEYRRARPSIGLDRSRVLQLASRGPGSDLGLHPAMEGMKNLYDDGLCAVVQGVGYPNPNRSHFASMDIWQTADTTGTGDGWIGRYVDSECCGYGRGESGRSPTANSSTPSQDQIHPPIAVMREAPLALQGRAVRPVAFESVDLFRWTGEDVHESLADPYQRIMSHAAQQAAAHAEGDHDPTAAFLTRTALDARASSAAIRDAVSAASLVEYPNTALGRQLELVAKMIRAGLKTRIYYASHGGFDTHAGQGGANGRHANLLRQLADAMRAFYADLGKQGNDGRVLTMSFSEFGRRVGQNASGGTDHGTAAPMFLMGPMVRAGVIGDHPSLRDLDDGDLKYKLDFRSVYAGIIEDWLGGDSAAALGERFRPAKVIRS